MSIEIKGVIIGEGKPKVCVPIRRKPMMKQF